MLIGVPKEIKNHEYRVGIIPANVRELTARGHSVFIETLAGAKAGFTDELYRLAGAIVLPSAEEVFEKAQLIVKVKEPQPNECKYFKKDQILFAFLHLAADPTQAQLLRDTECAAIAYETVTDDKGNLPLLTPMSEIAGRISIQVGARFLEKIEGGRGILLGGVPGVSAAKVLVLGGGAAGTQALRMAIGMGADLHVFDKSLARLRELDAHFEGRINTHFSSRDAIEQHLMNADLVIGAILVPGGATPKIVTREMINKMRPGSVLVDLSIDQGGAFETSRPTTFSEPTYTVQDVIHYCVTNMPAAVPRTAAVALNNATLPFILELAEKGLERAILENSHLLAGLNIYRGKITHPRVAGALNQSYSDPRTLITNN